MTLISLPQPGETGEVKSKIKKKKGPLYYWFCALGEKSHPHCNKTSDRVALIRTLIVLQAVITNVFIVVNAIHNLSAPKISPYEKVSHP